MRHHRYWLGASADADAADARMSLEVFHDGSGRHDGLVLAVHGRNGCSHSPHLMKLVRPYVARGWLVVAPDCCGSAWNDSAGVAADFTMTAHVRDAGRALAWAFDHAPGLGWTGRQLGLCGHSAGGYAAARLAVGDVHDRVGHLLLVSPFTSGTRQLEARQRYHENGLANLAAEVPRALTEWPTHDILPDAGRLDMPVGLIAGGRDIVTPLENISELQARLPRALPLLTLTEASHCLEGGSYRQEIGDRIDRLLALAANPPPAGGSA